MGQKSRLALKKQPGKWVVVADSHLGRRPGDIESFIGFLQSRDWQNCGLVLLGDVFDIWVAKQRFLQPDHRPVISALAQLRANRQAPVILCVGNRDICAAPSETMDAFDHVVRDGEMLSLSSGVRAYLTHGDLINAEDFNYRRLRKVVHSKAFYFFISMFPAWLIRWLVVQCERRLARSNLKHKQFFPRRMFQAFLDSLPSDPAEKTIALAGHFHPGRHISLESSGVTGHVLVPWFLGNSYYELDSDGNLQPATYDAGEKNN